MAFVPGYEHDIFVSYAHVDDLPFPGARHGWVASLVSSIETRLSQLLGRKDAFSLWADRELVGRMSLTRQLLDAARGSATLLVVVSPGYVASEWCHRERNAFLEMMRERSRSTVFVLEREPVEESEKPVELRDLRGFRFWAPATGGKGVRILGFPTPSKRDVKYYGRIEDLCRELTVELKALRAAGLGRTEATAAPATVFLAHVPYDLESERDEVKRYLDQSGLAVLPRSPGSLDPAEFLRSVQQDLPSCGLFVQLLNAVPEEEPVVTLEQVLAQQEAAKAARKPILHWRHPRLNLAAVQDERLRKLLEAETVRAESLEEFKKEVRRRALEPPSPPPARRVSALVFVDAARPDEALADQICAELDQHGADSVLLCYGRPTGNAGSPGEPRARLEKHLADCDGLIVVYGESGADWVDEQLLQCRKTIAGRTRELPALAVFQGPPERKERLSVRIRGLEMVDCRQGLRAEDVRRFVERTQGSQAT